MSLDDLHTLDVCLGGEAHPDDEAVPGLFSFWVC